MANATKTLYTLHISQINTHHRTVFIIVTYIISYSNTSSFSNGITTVISSKKKKKKNQIILYNQMCRYILLADKNNAVLRY
jgi:hypothetical protein